MFWPLPVPPVTVLPVIVSHTLYGDPLHSEAEHMDRGRIEAECHTNHRHRLTTLVGDLCKPVKEFARSMRALTAHARETVGRVGPATDHDAG